MANYGGKIEDKKVVQATSKAGKPYTRCEFLINSKKWSTFDEKLIESFNIGDYVDYYTEVKGQYENLIKMNKVDEPDVNSTPVKPGVPQETKELPKPCYVETQISIVKKDKANSFEFGKPGARHKVYYNEPHELFQQLETLVEFGLCSKEDFLCVRGSIADQNGNSTEQKN